VTKRVFEPDFHFEFIPVSLNQVYLQGGDFALAPQDTIFVFNKWELLDTLSIEVEGNVRKPGKIPYVKNMRISDAIISAGGFKADTYRREIHVIRYSPDITETEIIRADFGEVANNFSGDVNTVLGPNDKVIVFSKWNFSFPDSVSIFGEVKEPGDFKYVRGMVVSDLIKHAGGFTEGTYKLYVEIVRSSVVGDSLEMEKIIKLDLKGKSANAIDFELQSRDNVYIRKIIDFNRTISVTLNGLFNFPGVYRAEKGERLSSIIKRAGGFRNQAFLPGLVFSRRRVRERQTEHLRKVADKLGQQLENMLTHASKGTTAEDQAYRTALIKQRMDMLKRLKAATALGRVVLKIPTFKKFANSEYDLVAEDGDELTVTENLSTVSVLGEVFAPITVVYSRETNTIGECLDKAGSVTEGGDEDNIYLVKADGTVVTPKTTGFFTRFRGIDVGAGATIVVPPKVPKKSMLGDLEKITTIIYNLALSTGVVYTLFVK